MALNNSGEADFKTQSQLIWSSFKLFCNLIHSSELICIANQSINDFLQKSNRNNYRLKSKTCKKKYVSKSLALSEIRWWLNFYFVLPNSKTSVESRLKTPVSSSSPTVAAAASLKVGGSGSSRKPAVNQASSSDEHSATSSPEPNSATLAKKREAAAAKKKSQQVSYQPSILIYQASHINGKCSSYPKQKHEKFRLFFVFNNLFSS